MANLTRLWSSSDVAGIISDVPSLVALRMHAEKRARDQLEVESRRRSVLRRRADGGGVWPRIESHAGG